MVIAVAGSSASRYSMRHPSGRRSMDRSYSRRPARRTTGRRGDPSGDRGLHHPLRLCDAVALRVVDPEAGEHLDDLGVLGELRDGLLAGEVPDLVDRAHHLAIDRIAQDLAHEAAVDLEVIDREVLEVAEGGEPGAEVIQRELAAELLQRLDEAVRLREARYRRGLGDLEADLGGIEPAAVELLDDERQELVIAEALPGEIDGALPQLLALVRLGHEPAEGVLDHPAVDRRGDGVALGGGDEVIRRDDASGLVLEAQQQLVVRTALGALQRLDRHAEQLETSLFQSRVDARRPLHLAPPPHELDVVLGEAVDAVAAALLRRGAGGIGRREDRGHVLVIGGDRHDADAGTEAEHPVLPGEAEVAHALAECLRGAHRLIEGAALEKNAELVTAQARERIPPADLRFEQRPDLAEERVAGAVTAGVVDDLELVDVEVAECVGRLARLGALQRPLEAALELAPVHEPGEQIVARVIGEPAVELARLAHIVEHQHPAGHVPRAIADRRGGALDIELVAIAPDEEHRPHRLDGANAADRHRQRILERLAGLLVEGAEDLLHRASHGVFQAPAGELFRHRVDVVDGGAGIGGDDAIADRLQRDLRALLLAEQRLLVELALSDVELDADQAQEPSVLVDARGRAADHPAPLAVAMAHAMGALEDRRLAGDVIADRSLYACQIVRVHEAAP